MFKAQSESYAPRFKELERQIKAEVPDAVVRGAVGRTSSFEVIVDDEEVFSKLQIGAFPNMREIVEVVKAASEGEEIRKVTDTESSFCIIL
ncbi:migration and invasion enhancer 1 [Parasteatoda tepidariorum]|uniref:migration and invasion enhancer 1 n=1 Tax=Parasteatoda tepidariorum TaxID=114398 RepID=UPI001C7218B6|nr:uncharacterized protein LOC107450595 [Parasteatoda tepidariorum]